MHMEEQDSLIEGLQELVVQNRKEQASLQSKFGQALPYSCTAVSGEDDAVQAATAAHALRARSSSC